MANFEDLRLIDLVTKFREGVAEIYSSKNLSQFKYLSPKLQSVYNFHLTSKNSFAKQEEYLKNLYSSFNYAAVIINDAIKKGELDAESKAMLGECLEIMLACCDNIINSFNN